MSRGGLRLFWRPRRVRPESTNKAGRYAGSLLWRCVWTACMALMLSLTLAPLVSLGSDLGFASSTRAAVGHRPRTASGGAWALRRCSNSGGESTPVVTGSLGAGLPPPQLEGTRWQLLLDIGRTPFTLMPLTWATGGVRAEIPVAVEFRANGQLAVVGAGEFLGEWAEPVEDPAIVQLLPLLSALLPEPERVLLRPKFSSGEWTVLEDGRTVRFWIDTTGFRRDNLWLPQGRLYFRAQAYGQMLATGKNAAVSIRQSRAAIGAAAGGFVGVTMGPVAVVACAAAMGYALREVPITVGNYVSTRVQETSGDVLLPSEQVTELEALCDHYRQSFQQEQLISKQLAEERRRALEELGLSVESGSTDVLDKGQGLPYLVNLSEDPFLEGCLMYVLRCGVTTTLGTADDNHIRLKGLGVAEHHCAIQHEEGDRLILRVSCLEDVLASQGSNPESSRCFGVSDAEAAGGGERAAADSQSQQGVGIEYPRTLVNGRRVGSAPAQLRHQDRLILGHALVFRVGVPAAEARPRRGSGSPEIVCEGDNQCQLEQALAEVNEPQCATVLKLCSFSEMLPKEMLGKFMQDVNLAAPLVEEAGLIAQHVRPEEGLEFRLQVSLDVLSATSVGTSGAPEIVIAVMAKSNQDGTAADSFTLPPAALGVGHSPQKRTLRFVWSFEKFRSRLQVMRDVYEEFQARGLEEVRRRLRKEPYDDPWKEIGNGEVQLLLQGLGTADADEERATVGSVTCSTEVGSEDGFYDGGGNSLRARRNFVAARLGRYVDEASCGASSADESGECDAEVNRWEGAEWYTLGRKRSKNIVGAGGRAQQGVAPATYQAAANYSAEASAQRGAALLTPLLRTKTVTQEWGVHVTNLQKWEERIDAKQDLMQRIWEDVRHLQELEPSTHSRRSSGLSASSERSLQSSPTAQFKEVRFSEVPPSSK